MQDGNDTRCVVLRKDLSQKERIFFFSSIIASPVPFVIVQSPPTLITIFICTLNINTIFSPHRHIPGPHMSPHRVRLAEKLDHSVSPQVHLTVLNIQADILAPDSCTARQLVSKGEFNPGVDVMLVDTMSPSNLSRCQEQSFSPVSAKLGKTRSGRSGWREVKM